MSIMSLNGGTFDISNSSLNINNSNITLLQNYGITGGITDVCSNMFNVVNSNLSFPKTTVFGSNLGLNNLWTGKNTINNDVSFNNTKTQINSSSLIGLSGGIVNISGGSVNVSGYTTIGGGNTIFNSNNIYLNSIPNTSDLSCISYNPTTKQIGYVNLPNNLPTNNVWTGTNTFSTDVSFNSGTARFNNTTTQITSSSLVGLSGGVVNISGGTVNISGSTTISGTSTHTGPSIFNNNATFTNTSTQVTSNTININSNLSNAETIDTSNNLILQNTLYGLPNSLFGNAIVLSSDGSTMAVSSIYESLNNGAVRIYTKSGSTITLQGTIVPPANIASFFGTALAISSDGNTLAIGAHVENGATGAARIYKRTAGVWNTTPEGSFTGPSGESYFGISVALSSDGNAMVVGSFKESSDAGAVRTYIRSGSSWSIQGSALTSDISNGLFGTSISLDASGNTLAVGSQGETATRVYTRANNTTTSWTQKGATLSLGIPGSSYGRNVALSSDGNTLAVGACGELSSTGTVRVYLWNGSSWNIQGSYLTAGLVDSYFGVQISLSSDGNTLAVGSQGESNRSGAFRIYNRPNTTGTWTQTGKAIILGKSDSYFGCAVALSSDGMTVAVGAQNEYQTNTMVGGNTGSVRVYTRNLSTRLNLNGVIGISGDRLDITSNSININNNVVIGSSAPQTNYVLANPLNIPPPQQISSSSAGVNGIFGGWNSQNVVFSGDSSVMVVGCHDDSTYSTNAGAVVIYNKPTVGGPWVKTQIINGPTSSEFGKSIALSVDGSRMFVGAPGYIFNGNANAGIVYFYKRNIGGTGYTFDNNIPRATANLYYGTSLACSSDGNILVVGEPGSNSIRMYVGGADAGNVTLDSSVNSVAISADGGTVVTGVPVWSSNTGYVNIYSYNGSTLTFQQSFAGTTTYSYFGEFIALSYDGKTLAVGARGLNSYTGAVYTYTKENSIWLPQQVIYNNVQSSLFGSVTMSYNGNIIAIGSKDENSKIGAARIYTRSGGNWELYKMFTQSVYTSGDVYWGNVCKISPDGSTLAVGSNSANRDLFIYSLKTPQLTLAVGDTTTPGRLVVTNRTGENFTRFQTDYNAVNQTSGIEFGIPAFTTDQCSKITSTTYPYEGNDLQFYTNSSSGKVATSRMTITKDGNVAITSSQPYSNMGSNPMSSQMTLNTSTGGERLYLGTYYTAGVGSVGAIQSSDYYGNTDHYNALILNPNGGNVGIGTTNPESKVKIAKNINSSDVIHYQHQLQLEIGRVSDDKAMVFGVMDNGIGVIQVKERGTGYNKLCINPIWNSTTHVGIGTFSPNYPFEVNSYIIPPNTETIRYFNYDNNFQTTQNNQVTSIKSYGYVWSSYGFMVSSDIRIKTNIVDIDDSKALSILRQIQPKTYDYIDKIKRSNDNVIGFIAQEIKEIIPKAVSIVKDYVPTFMTRCQVSTTDTSNILLVTSHIDLSWNPLHDQSGNAFLDTSGNASSDSSGNKCFNVKLYDQSNNEIVCKTTDILDKRTFLIDISGTEMANVSGNIDSSGNIVLKNNGEYFLYGQEIDDFHTLDKLAIFTVVTAAVQDIDRIQQAQQVQIQADTLKISELQSTVTTLESKNASLESTVATQQSQIVTHQSQIASQQSLLASQQSQISALEEKLTAIMTRLGM